MANHHWRQDHSIFDLFRTPHLLNFDAYVLFKVVRKNNLLRELCGCFL